jgi:hypothetical protein
MERLNFLSDPQLMLSSSSFPWDMASVDTGRHKISTCSFPKLTIRICSLPILCLSLAKGVALPGFQRQREKSANVWYFEIAALASRRPVHLEHLPLPLESGKWIL